MISRPLRHVLFVVSVSALCVATTLGGLASAGPTKGIKGDPQPEMKPFTIGASTSGGNVAIKPNGGLVVAYDIGTGNGETRVCLLARGGHACTHTTSLSPLSGDDTFDVPEVYALSDSHVVVLQNTCCDASANGGDLLYTSTDGGEVFGAPVRVGSVGVGAATLIGSTIVFTGGNAHIGAQVESISDDASGPPATTATVNDNQPPDVGIGSYKSGVLAANDVLGSDYTTHVEYAAAGKNFNDSASYLQVASYSHEYVVAMSGDALLTRQTTGKEELILRFFNGTSFGAAHDVPGYAGHTLGSWNTMDRDPAGVTHLFIEANYVSPIYDLQEISTTTGAHWTHRTNLGNAIDNDVFGVRLDSIGSGLVLGGNKAIGYPVLARQTVSFKLKKSKIKKGHKTIGSGKARTKAAGRKIELQIKRKGRWFDVKSTHESSSGHFKFSIKGKSVGKHTYRAVASDKAGYIQFGYSAGRALHVKK
jgi:hypothetical protein